MKLLTRDLRPGNTIISDEGDEYVVADAMERWPNPHEGAPKVGLGKKKTKMWDVTFRDIDAVVAPFDAEWNVKEPVN